MGIIQMLLVGASIIILVINFIVNSVNIIRIINYCLQTNTLNEYWEQYNELCVSRKTIISNIISFIIALIVFIIMIPVILLREPFIRFLFNEVNLFIKYSDLNLQGQNLMFTNNVEVMGIEKFDIKVTGKLKIDSEAVVSEITKKCISLHKKLEIKTKHQWMLKNTEVMIPIYATIEGKSYTIFFIYNNQHKMQFEKINNLFLENGYRQCIYFSIV